MNEEMTNATGTTDEITIDASAHETEYITADGVSYKTESVQTGTGSICLTLADVEITEAVEKFRGVTELDVSGADQKPYGIYQNLTFISATVDETGLVTVAYHIASDDDLRLSGLEQSQTDQDEAIAALMFGGEADA